MNDTILRNTRAKAFVTELSKSERLICSATWWQSPAGADRNLTALC